VNRYHRRRRLKRRLLDVLDGEYKFDLPPTLVNQEVDAIWRNLTADMERAGRSFADEGTNEEEAKADYRKIAERRVRLGLLLAEIGERNQIKVLDEEINRALFERARQFPGQEREVIEFYRKTPEALAELRAPIFEEKAVDYILELAKVSENKIERAALFAPEEGEPGTEAEAEAPKPKRTRKKAE
jgi:trigger factor